MSPQKLEGSLPRTPGDAGLRVLMIEDDEDDVVLVQAVLPRDSFSIDWSTDAASARTELAREKYDVVLLDHGLPDTNALAFLEELKLEYPSLPVIVLTGRVDPALAVSAVKKGATNFILKDEVALHLAAAIREASSQSAFARPDGQSSRPFAESAGRIYNVLLETMNEGLLVVDRQGIVTFTNRALGAASGRDATDLLGQPFRPIFDEPGRALVQQALTELFSGKPAGSLSFEAALLRPDGVSVPVLVSGRTLEDEAGSVEACLLTLADISELAQSRAELLRANEQLRALDELKSHFLSMVAHDLRTPISAVSLAADYILEGLSGDMNGTQRELLTVIQRNVGRLSRMVTSLLDVTRIEAGDLVLERRPAELVRLVQDQIEEIGALVRDSRRSLLFEPPAEALQMRVDADRMAQVVTNLLSNALRFAESRVLVRLSWDAAEARLEVEDDGPGIPEDELPRLFGRFVRIQAHGKKSGTGLGLFIVRRLVEAHGGSVRAENRQEGGARFVVKLPREAQP
jgi:two-component system, OmpR family, phosphate regulon sensor histidine kinase PhoR